jgi:hypothetical protein
VASIGPWNNIAALAVVPVAVWIIASGSGLLIERVAGVRFPDALVVPMGFCFAIVLALGAYETGIGDELAIPVVAICAAAGLVLARRQLRARLSAGWPLLAAIAAYVLFNGSVIATGHWTWTGYNIDADSAHELLLISHMQAHGTQPASTATSSADTVISAYLSTGYPLGAQALLGVISGLLAVSPAVVWQGFIASAAAVATMAASLLSGRTMGRRTAALAGLVAVASALTYQYALQGAIKEVAVVAALMCALALMRHTILSGDGRAAAVVVIAVPLAAILASFNAAGVPYVLSLIGAGVAGLLLVHPRRPTRAWIRPAGVGVVTLAVLAIPALITVGTFAQVASAGYGASSATAPTLGPLLRPLPLSEISGVWLYGDYRFPVPSGLGALLTVIATVMILLLLAPGVLRMVAAREPGPLMGLIVVALVMAIVYPLVVPYAEAKLLMIGSPIVILCALQALTGARGWDWKVLGGLAAAAIGVAVLASDALAYHAWPVAPTSRMLALQEVGKRVGAHGPVLDSEFEQFAKYFTQPAQVIVGPDAPGPEAISLRDPGPQYGASFDLNQERLGFIESFPYVLIRRSPLSSPPPANYNLVLRNRFYEVWKRSGQPDVYAELPLEQSLEGLAPAHRAAACRALGAIARDAPAGSRLVVARLPSRYGYLMANASNRSPGWAPDSGLAGGVITTTPGQAEKTIHVQRSGLYELWVQGNFTRRVSVKLDGHTVGSVEGSNTPGAWLSGGVAYVTAGRHVLAVERGGGGLGPGNGSTQAAIGAVALAAHESPRISTLPLGSWRSLCGGELDWVEVVGSG